MQHGASSAAKDLLAKAEGKKARNREKVKKIERLEEAKKAKMAKKAE